MSDSRRRFVVAGLALVALACTSGSTATPAVRVDHVTITGQTSSSLAVGTQVNLTANAYGTNNTALSDKNFSWASSDSATVSVEFSGGYATVVAHAVGGPVTISATVEGTSGSALFTVTQAPTIGLSTGSLTFLGSVNGGTIPTQSVAVTNIGNGSLTGLAVGSINYLSGSNWITTSWNTTTAPATLALGVISGLSAGTYSAAVPITSSASGVTNAPQSVSVTLVMSPPLATQLALTTSPSATATVNVPFVVQPILQLRDANGVAVAQSGVLITATLASGSGSLGGTTTATTNAAGAAAFSNLSLSVVGSNTIRFSASVSGGTFAVTSQSIVVSVPTVALTVQGIGAGNGTVTSSPSGISCVSSGGTTSGLCSASYGGGTVVTLTATATNGTFAGWSGACTNGSGACQVTMSQAQSVTASFTLTYTVVVTGSGTGTGTVTAPAAAGQPAISCTITSGSTSGVCGGTYPQATIVPLQATGTGGSTFTSWSNACSGAGTVAQCILGNVSGPQTATASFAAPAFLLTVSGSGTGNGTVTSNPSGINCGSTAGGTSGTCSSSYTNGTLVTLTATATSGTFTGWSGACTNGSGACQVTLSQARNVTASFSAPALLLSVVGGGTGNGTVTAPAVGGQPAFNCTITNGIAISGCTQSYPVGTQVQMTATGTGGGAFSGWGVPCTGFANPCSVISSATITATFVPPGTCPNTAISLGIPVTGTLTSSCPTFPSGQYYAKYTAVLASAQTIAINTSASFNPNELFVQVTSTGDAVGYFGPSPLQFKILAPAGTLALFPNGVTAGTTGIFSLAASQSSAFVANCEDAVLVPGGTWNESLSSGACVGAVSYYDLYLAWIPAGATATVTMSSTFGPALALYDQSNSTLVTSAGALGNVATIHYTNLTGQAALYSVHAASGSFTLTGSYTLSFSLTGPGSLRQAGSSSGGSTPVGAGVPAHHQPR